MKAGRDDIKPYVTLDGSSIRELIHPDRTAAKNQSLAEATVPPGIATRLHRHHASEEVYHISAGIGLMTLDEQTFAIQPGDSVLIAPGTPHKVENTGDSNLVILCACSPAYAHEDTELLD